MVADVVREPIHRGANHSCCLGYDWDARGSDRDEDAINSARGKLRDAHMSVVAVVNFYESGEDAFPSTLVWSGGGVRWGGGH